MRRLCCFGNWSNEIFKGFAPPLHIVHLPLHQPPPLLLSRRPGEGGGGGGEGGEGGGRGGEEGASWSSLSPRSGATLPCLLCCTLASTHPSSLYFTSRAA